VKNSHLANKIKRKGRKRRAAGITLLALAATLLAWSQRQFGPVYEWHREQPGVTNPYWKPGEPDFGPRLYTKTTDYTIYVGNGYVLLSSVRSVPFITRPGADLLPTISTNHPTPIAPFAIGAVIAGGILLTLGWRAGRGNLNGCEHCDYSLTGLAKNTPCPECGKAGTATT
jgi:hypothetical protein